MTPGPNLELPHLLMYWQALQLFLSLLPDILNSLQHKSSDNLRILCLSFPLFYQLSLPLSKHQMEESTELSQKNTAPKFCISFLFFTLPTHCPQPQGSVKVQGMFHYDVALPQPSITITSIPTSAVSFRKLGRPDDVLKVAHLLIPG